ncbi:MAG: YdiU family protein [Candidatus Izemoplasma sp.]|nr:YdiU family protein [Candidatus Izemoplasma sp.]
MIKQHSYLTLPNILYRRVESKSYENLKWVLFNHDLADNLALNRLHSDRGKHVLSGGSDSVDYFSQAYSGHQFGHFTTLGDGRALNVGEIEKDNTLYDVQLKGSGHTPYSRSGDGKATLYSMLREYLIGEALYALNVPTSRTLSIIGTGEKVIRARTHKGAIASRIARSHLRIGTFQYAYVKGGIPLVKRLADYAIEQLFPKHIGDYYGFFHEVIKRQAQLIAKWQSIGFIHGVLNTDNVFISGESLDFGPCAFMDYYDPNTVYSSIDRLGRYKYSQQPIITSWNISKLAETLYPLFDDNQDLAIEKANKLITSFEDIYTYYYHQEMSYKLGFKSPHNQLVHDLLHLMEVHTLDYTNTFIKLTKNQVNDLLEKEGFDIWYNSWQKAIKDFDKATTLMTKHNPIIIPRNHVVEEALSSFAFNDDDTLFQHLLTFVKNPFNYQVELPEKFQTPNPNDEKYVTYCGT